MWLKNTPFLVKKIYVENNIINQEYLSKLSSKIQKKIMGAFDLAIKSPAKSKDASKYSYAK